MGISAQPPHVFARPAEFRLHSTARVPYSLDQAELRPGEPLEVMFRDGLIEIEPAPREVRIKAHHGFRVAEPVDSSEILEEKTVRKIRDRTRSRRKSR